MKLVMLLNNSSETRPQGPMAETSLLKEVQVAMVKAGAKIFRNNVGSFQRKDGAWVSFGLCEGSSDLIGWRSVKITPEMVGRRVAVFVAVEVKAPKAKTKKERLAMQAAFIQAVKDAGGCAAILNSVEVALDFIGGPIGK